MTGAILGRRVSGTKSGEKVTCQKGEALFQKGVRRGGARGEGTEVSRRGSCSSPSGDKLFVILKKRVI
jgi:hypothetical protein